MTFLYILGSLTLLGIGFIAFRVHSSLQDGDPRLKADVEKKDRIIGELENTISKMQSEMDENAGKAKQIYENLKNAEADIKTMTKERDLWHVRATKLESEQEQREKKSEDMIQKQDAARQALEDEKVRIRKEDELQKEEELAERDRMWGQHEQHVQSMLRDICKNPQYAFSCFDNTNLPDGFDGSLKPDFLVEFLGQYIIFDAKVTRSQDIQTYITNSVKSTAKKVKNNPNIYPTIFLVIPTEAISEIGKLSYVDQGFSFFIVSPESLEPIIASLKKISNYELADQFDPQEREGIVNWIARLDYHINARNTFDVLLAEKGAELLSDAEKLNPELAKEVQQKKEKMKPPTLKQSDMKKLVGSILERNMKSEELTAPKAKVELSE